MPCPHFSVSIRSRGGASGGSAVGGSAYQNAEKFFSEYDQRTKNYEYKKAELVYSDVLLPEQAPSEYRDPEVLWNAVEDVETQWNAQLSRGIIAALPREIPMEDSIKLVEEFCRENFVSQGMCCDFAIHDPDPPNHNPHVHIMLTMRGIDEDGRWLPKSKKEYVLDEHGEKVRLPSGEYKSRKVDLMGWNNRKNVTKWRQSWEAYQNRYLELRHRPERVSLASNKDQGLEKIPTVHMGPAVAAMERKGIKTEIGNLNREIKKANRMIDSIRNMINTLADWIISLHEAYQEFKEERQPSEKPVYFGDLLIAKMELRSKERNDWKLRGQMKGIVSDLKKVSSFAAYLDEQKILTAGDLNNRLLKIHEEMNGSRQIIRTAEKRLNELDRIHDAFIAVNTLQQLRDQYVQIGWKSKKEKFYSEHRTELNAYNRSYHFLKEHLKSATYNGKELVREAKHLDRTIETERDRLQQCKSEMKALKQIESYVKDLLPEFVPELSEKEALQLKTTISKSKKKVKREHSRESESVLEKLQRNQQTIQKQQIERTKRNKKQNHEKSME